MRYTTSIFMTFILLISFMLPACEKDDPTPPADASFIGDFISVAHTTSGVVTIDQDKTTLTFTNFKTDSGPDLNIYLSRSSTNVTADYIDLGDMKGRNGNYTYALPSNTDYTQYKYVIVWCVDFDVNFGYAELVDQ